MFATSTAKKATATKVFCIVIALVLAFGLSPFSKLGGVERAYAGTFESVTGSSDGTNITLNVSVTGINQWYDEANFQVTYDDGSTATLLLKTATANNSAHVEYNWATVNGSSFTLSNASDSAYTGTAVIPLSVFGGKSFTLTSGNTKITSEQLAAGSGSSNTGNQGGDQGNTSGDQGNQGDQSNTGDQGGGVSIGTLTPSVSGLITVDGANEDWGGISALASNSSDVAEWKLARDTDGNVYVMFDGTASTQWYDNYQHFNLKFTQNGSSVTIPYDQLPYQANATTVHKNNANWNNPAPYVAEAMIPASYFTDSNATIEFVGETVAVADIPVVDGNDVTPDAPTTYQGIVIDGVYTDWAPVTKYPSNDDAGLLQNVAMVWDGDTVYLYLEDTPNTLGAYNAGSHDNGKYEIITDLGKRMVFQLYADGAVSGIEGADCKHVGNKWEISFPASDLPEYRQSISFGLYQEDSMITGVTNLNGSGSGGTFDGIVYDGVYGDWDYYPHHLIQYATAGTQEDKPDAEGALYADSEAGKLYGHVKVTMQRHLDNGNGHEFTTGVTIRFNDNTSMEFYPRSTTTDASGNINWNPQMRDLPNGTYEFSLMSRDAWGTSGNLSNVNEHDYEYGRMYVTVSDTADECEFYLDLGMIADKLGVDANDFKVIAAQFINIGQEWITTAGTSTAPFVGIGLGIGAVACVLGWRRFYDKDSAKRSTGKNGDSA